MTDRYETVPRPKVRTVGGRLRHDDSMVGHLRETAETGQALKIPLTDAGYLSGGLTTSLRKQGYRLHRHRDGDSYIAWCERIEENGRTR